MTEALSLEEHPIMVADKIRSWYGPNIVFTYSVYEIAPPGLQEQAPRSPVHRVMGQELTFDWLLSRLAELGQRQEMALHSVVEYNGELFHIPMIDFADRRAASAVAQVKEAVTAEITLTSDLVLFDTGRSFHGYFPELIPYKIWPKYFGRLLTLNESSESPLIDARWIGHALVRGFAALRWSNNTARYLRMPRAALEIGLRPSVDENVVDECSGAQQGATAFNRRAANG